MAIRAHIAEQAGNTGRLMCIFAGPVLDNANDIRHDFGAGEVQIPRRFWKIVIVAENPRTPGAQLEAFAFVLDQSKAIDQFGIERFSVGEFDTFQKTLQDITDLSGVTFDASLHAVDAMTGSPWQLTTLPTTVSLWFRDGFALRGADILSTHLLRHLLWTPPLLIAAYIFYLATAERETRRGALDWMLVMMAATLYFYVERGGNQYGPRFHYEVFPFLVLFVTANLFREPAFVMKARRDRLAFGFMAASVAALPLLMIVHVIVERNVIEERSDPYTSVEEARLQNAVVLIGGRIGTERSIDALDLTRNGITQTSSVLYGLDVSPAANCGLRKHYPGRRFYLYYWDRARDDGVLEPLVCPGGQ